MSIPSVGDILATVAKDIPNIQQLVQQIDSPDKIDAVLTARAMPARLYNFKLATRISTPVGAGLYVPVQISIRDGARKSFYLLNVNEEVLAGTLITQFDAYDSLVRRDTGANGPARTGDLFTIRWVSQDGRQLTREQFPLQILDEGHGIGALGENTMVWVLWSCVRV